MIYLDYAATHPMTPAALAAYAEAAALPGNPASVHAAGQAAREKLEEGRARIAAALGVDPRTLTLNSGGTEGDNHVLLGVAQGWEDKHGRPGHLVTTQTEHSAVLAPARALALRERIVKRRLHYAQSRFQLAPAFFRGEELGLHLRHLAKRGGKALLRGLRVSRAGISFGGKRVQPVLERGARSRLPGGAHADRIGDQDRAGQDRRSDQTPLSGIMLYGP